MSGGARFTNETHEMDFAVGGLWRYTMYGPDGRIWPNWIRYTGITAPIRIAFDHGSEMAEPAHFAGLITYDDMDAKTRVTLTLVFPTAQTRDATIEFGVVAGENQTLAKLEDCMLGRQNKASPDGRAETQSAVYRIKSGTQRRRNFGAGSGRQNSVISQSRFVFLN